LFGSAETPFTFSLAETQYLFTAPLTASGVDLSCSGPSFRFSMSAVLSALVFSSGSGDGAAAFSAWWAMAGVHTLQLHYAGASLVRAVSTQHG